METEKKTSASKMCHSCNWNSSNGDCLSNIIKNWKSWYLTYISFFKSVRMKITLSTQSLCDGNMQRIICLELANSYNKRIFKTLKSLKENYCWIKELNIELNNALSEFENSITRMKRILIKFSINCIICNKLSEIRQRHDKKLAKWIIEKRIQDGMLNDPNAVITNHTDTTLSNYDLEILKYGLKHGAAIRPKKSEIIVIMEDI